MYLLVTRVSTKSGDDSILSPIDIPTLSTTKIQYKHTVFTDKQIPDHLSSLVSLPGVVVGVSTLFSGELVTVTGFLAKLQN